MEIIKDIKGGTLRLTRTALTERTGESGKGTLWRLPLLSLKTAVAEDWLTIYSVEGDAEGIAEFIPSANRIGCRYFTKTTFKKIMKAANKL
jgi:hypothetical protein